MTGCKRLALCPLASAQRLPCGRAQYGRARVNMKVGERER
jgi:hypothetical protein